VSLFYHRILQNAVVASTKDATGKKRGGGIAVERQGMLPISVISANVVSVLMLSVSVVNANVAVPRLSLFSLYPLLFTKFKLATLVLAILPHWQHYYSVSSE